MLLVRTFYEVVACITEFLAYPFISVVNRFKIYNDKHLLNGSPKFICLNHVSYNDWIILHSYLVYKKLRNSVGFIAKKDLTTRGIYGHFVTRDLLFFVDKKKILLEEYKKILLHVRQGGSVIIFPEGTRNRTSIWKNPQQGFLEMAIKTNAEICLGKLINFRWRDILSLRRVSIQFDEICLDPKTNLNSDYYFHRILHIEDISFFDNLYHGKFDSAFIDIDRTICNTTIFDSYKFYLRLKGINPLLSEIIANGLLKVVFGPLFLISRSKGQKLFFYLFYSKIDKITHDRIVKLYFRYILFSRKVSLEAQSFFRLLEQNNVDKYLVSTNFSPFVESFAKALNVKGFLDLNMENLHKSGTIKEEYTREVLAKNKYKNSVGLGDHKTDIGFISLCDNQYVVNNRKVSKKCNIKSLNWR